MNSNKPVRQSKMSPQMLVGLLAGLYGLSPIDVIPDFIPLVGWADDGGVIVLALVLMLAMTLAQWMTQGGDHE